jgi:hypothetical protein
VKSVFLGIFSERVKEFAGVVVENGDAPMDSGSVRFVSVENEE